MIFNNDLFPNPAHTRRVSRSTWLVVFLFSWLTPLLPAETFVYLQNDSPQPLTLEVRVEGGLSQGRHWNQTVYEMDPWQKSTPILWFNRDEGITSGRTFTFETLVKQNGHVIARLRQKLRGKWIGSSLSHGADNAVWFSDRAVHAVQSAPDIRTQFKSAFTGWYDDLVYTVHQEGVYDHLRGLTEHTADQFTLLAYNLQLLPTSISFIDQNLRARYVAESLAGFDAIVFSEAFDDDVRGFDEGGDTGDPDSLWERVRDMYPYRTDIVGKDEGLEQDGGVFIVSRWPISAQQDWVYDESICEASDCLSEKGVMYARIEKSSGADSRTYHLFGSHLQADYSNDDNSHVREAQLAQMRSFINSRAIPGHEPVIMAGDFNVDRDRAEYVTMLDTLNAIDYERADYGMPYSLDGFTNTFAGGTTEQLLDYVLIDQSRRLPRYGETAVLVLRSPAPEMFAKRGDQRRQDMNIMGNYSDHYPVFAYFDFSD